MEEQKKDTKKKVVKKAVDKKDSAIIEKLEALRIPAGKFEYKNAQIRHGYAEANKMLDDCICIVKENA